MSRFRVLRKSLTLLCVCVCLCVWESEGKCQRWRRDKKRVNLGMMESERTRLCVWDKRDIQSVSNCWIRCVFPGTHISVRSVSSDERPRFLWNLIKHWDISVAPKKLSPSMSILTRPASRTLLRFFYLAASSSLAHSNMCKSRFSLDFFVTKVSERLMHVLSGHFPAPITTHTPCFAITQHGPASY